MLPDFTEWRREEKQEGKKHQSNCMCSDWGPDLQSRLVAQPGIEPVTFGLWEDALTN